ncbi:MAG TPA: TPM domain-containing protein, partial [Verrucomicrobiae bacterium]|nr:TPM domain-containing protein [Verrucomicrobiae bacterium]
MPLLLFVFTALAAEVIPPKPERYFNDYAGVTSVAVQRRLDRQLEDLEKTDSTQIIVVIYKKKQSDSSAQEYTLRLAQKWGVGQKPKSNGAALFIFIEDREMFLQVGYGLEGAIPDATAKDITENRIKPYFRNGNYDQGVAAGVTAVIQAAHGEYKGTGRTVAQGGRQRKQNGFFAIAAVVFVLFLIASTRRRRGDQYRGSGRSGWGGPIFWGGAGGGSGSGSSGGGSGGGGGWSGGFSGGG